MKHFSENLQKLRELKGLNQTQISKILNVSPTTWNNYETGVSNPNILGLIEISNYFGVTETDLLHNASLLEELESGKYSLESKPKSKPNGKPKHENEGVLNDPKTQYQTQKSKEETERLIQSQRETIDTQKALISALNVQLERFLSPEKGKK